MTEDTISILQILSRAVRVLLAYAVFTFLMLLMMANWALPYFSVLKPQIMLIVVFYWTLYRPTMMPPWVILIIGLILDAMNPVMPIGTHAASYLLISGIMKPRRRMLMGQSFVVVWSGFAVAAVIDMIFKWIAMLILTGSGFAIGTIFLNGFITILAFPLLVLVMVMVHRILPPGRGMISR